MKKIRPMKTANSCRDGIQNRIICQLEFANAEIPWTFVETEANMHGLYVDLDVPAVKLPMLNQSMGRVVERQGIPDKCQWLTPPGTCIVLSRNNVIGDAFG